MSRSDRSGVFIAAMPALFVLLWSTGFIGAKYGLPYAEPFTFLAVRFVLVILVLGGVALATRAPWPTDLRLVGHLAVSGILVHAFYLSGVFASIHRGLPSGLSALIVGLQPLLTASMAGVLLGERVSLRQWAGLALGLGGVALVLSTRLGGVDLDGFGWDAPACAVAALLGITAGTLYQKRFCTGMDLRTGAVIQYAGALVVVTLAAFSLESMRIQWTTDFILAMAWLVIVLSVGAISLLMALIRRGEAARVASLFYLVPPVTTVLAWGLFDEQLTAIGLLGMVVAVAGVALVIRPGR
jgi:drug/metabolite transporter (DMT)-like permease